MTLGDRVVVLRGGLVQQIGSPQELYDHPRNLFVAGFIGSPSMNFVSGRLTDGGVTTSLGEIRLSDEARQKIASKNAKGDVVVGIRPEHLEDASLVESYQKINGSTFSARVEVLESMGSDKYIYFSAEGPKVTSRELDELAADSGADGGQLVARLSAESAARMGESIELWFDQKRVSVFDVESGANLTL